MNKYIIVRVQDGHAKGRHSSNVGLIRKAIHQASEDHDIPVADMVSHSQCMSEQETSIVSKIFEGVLTRVKYTSWIRKVSGTLN